MKHADFCAATLVVVLAASALALFAPEAFAAVAAPSSTVRVDYGAALNDLAQAALLGVGGALVWAFRFLPAHLRWAVTLIQADQLLEKALAKARADVAAALEGKTWSVDVKNKVVADALNYALKHFGKLVQSLGGAELVREKLQARLQEWIEKSVSR